MAVLVPNRTKSDAQFLNTARELEKCTRRRCISAPKRYTFYGLQELWQTARCIYGGVKRGNSIFPSNQHEAQMRRDCFIQARADIQDYVSQLELLLEDQILSIAAGEELSTLVRQEDSLIQSLMKSDKGRYATLP